LIVKGFDAIFIESTQSDIFRFTASAFVTKIEHMDNRNNYVCPKCGCTECETDQLQATGGNFSKLFDVQNKKFFTVTCRRCGYTELYKGKTSTFMNVVDFLGRNS
jgi:Predicted nucleic-acid-binding protein containing a Zn-ribbon domain